MQQAQAAWIGVVLSRKEVPLAYSILAMSTQPHIRVHIYTDLFSLGFRCIRALGDVEVKGDVSVRKVRVFEDLCTQVGGQLHSTALLQLWHAILSAEVHALSSATNTLML
jgi:hypothetical protein